MLKKMKSLKIKKVVVHQTQFGARPMPYLKKIDIVLGDRVDDDL